MPFAICSTGSSTERTIGRLAAALWLCAAPSIALAAGTARVAVLSPVDWTGRTAPLDQVQTAVESALSERGLAPVPRSDLEAVLRKHRIRYTGGISGQTARAIGEETGVEGVLVTSIDDFETVDPPRFAMTCRWIQATSDAVPAWMETSARHGHEHPGAFGMGLISSVDVLIERSAGEMSASLAAFLRSGGPAQRGDLPRRFRPGVAVVNREWVSAAFSGSTPRVAVLPFIVDGARRDVGEVIASQFVRALIATGRMSVLEPGVVREALLEARLIQEGGPSLPQVDALRALLDVDLVVSGRVTDYEAMGSAPGSPFVGFSARGLDSRTRQVVWSSFSFGPGDDRPGPFGVFRIRSSIALASDLVRGAVEALEQELPPRDARGGAPTRKDDNR